MKNYRIFAASFALAAALACSPSPATAQGPVTAASIAAPVVVKVFQAIAQRHATPEGSEWLKAEVIHADAVTLIVREQDNGYAVHTFNFSPDLQPKMQAMLDKGGFQYGDKVSILFMPGQTVALRIHGKASKPL